MNTLLDLSAMAVAGSVLAYQLICLQSEQRALREAIDDRLAALSENVPKLNPDVAIAVADAVMGRLQAMTPQQKPALVDATPELEDGATTPAMAQPGTSLPGGVNKGEARRKLMDELEAMTTDKIRSEVRKLDPAKRELFRRKMSSPIDKARKGQLIAGMVAAFGL